MPGTIWTSQMSIEHEWEMLTAIKDWQDARRNVLSLPPADNSKPLPPERIAAYEWLGRAECRLNAIKV